MGQLAGQDMTRKKDRISFRSTIALRIMGKIMFGRVVSGADHLLKSDA